MQKYVCQNCFSDIEIRKFIQGEAKAKVCSFCGNTPAAQLRTVLDYIERCFRRSPHESEPNIYEGSGKALQSSLECFYQFWAGTNPEVLDILAKELTEYSGAAYLNLAGGTQKLSKLWDKFCYQVKHECRFVFYHQKLSKSHEYPWMILDEIGKYAHEFKMLKRLAPKAIFFRAHQSRHPIEHSAVRLGPPPPKLASQSRMSPAGIPMFYGAESIRTAQSEIMEVDKGSLMTFGKFETVRELQILDLSSDCELPSLFHPTRARMRPYAAFMNQFSNAVSLPLNMPNIEYVPTQIIAEYFRHIFKSKDGGKLDGILYKSSKAKGNCITLFCQNAECTIDPEDEFGVLCFLGAFQRFIARDVEKLRHRKERLR
jgi:hypothetical protein